MWLPPPAAGCRGRSQPGMVGRSCASLNGRVRASLTGSPESHQERRMGEPVTDSTHVPSLSYGLVRRLAEFIDPQEGWKKLAVDITNLSAESRYSQAHETLPIHEKYVQEKEEASVKSVLAQTAEKQRSDPSCLSEENSSSQSSNTDFCNFLFHDLESITHNFDA